MAAQSAPQLRVDPELSNLIYAGGGRQAYPVTPSSENVSGRRQAAVDVYQHHHLAQPWTVGLFVFPAFFIVLVIVLVALLQLSGSAAAVVAVAAVVLLSSLLFFTAWVSGAIRLPGLKATIKSRSSDQERKDVHD